VETVCCKEDQKGDGLRMEATVVTTKRQDLAPELWKLGFLYHRVNYEISAMRWKRYKKSTELHEEYTV